MAFKGTLKEFKVPDILQLISMQKKTGILTFNSQEGFVSIIFEDGGIVGIDAFPKKLEMRVGNVLVKQEKISEEMLQRALSIQKRTGQKVGEILIAMGLISEETIPEALNIQAVQILLSLFNWRKGEYNFKVMDKIEGSLKSLKPIATDTIIMEGVQMLDEWPRIKSFIPSKDMVFEAIPLEDHRIEIISEFRDEIERKEPGVLYLSENEISLLKHINGINSVRDLVDLGLYTEYKIFKMLYTLANKAVIQAKEKTKTQEIQEKKMLEELLLHNRDQAGRWIPVLWLILLIVFILTFLNPLKPLKEDNLLRTRDFYEKSLINPKGSF